MQCGAEGKHAHSKNQQHTLPEPMTEVVYPPGQSLYWKASSQPYALQRWSPSLLL